MIEGGYWSGAGWFAKGTDTIICSLSANLMSWLKTCLN